MFALLLDPSATPMTPTGTSTIFYMARQPYSPSACVRSAPGFVLLRT